MSSAVRKSGMPANLLKYLVDLQKNYIFNYSTISQNLCQSLRVNNDFKTTSNSNKYGLRGSGDFSLSKWAFLTQLSFSALYTSCTQANTTFGSSRPELVISSMSSPEIKSGIPASLLQSSMLNKWAYMGHFRIKFPISALM